MRNKKNKQRRFLQGTAIVETALVLPLLFMVTFGAIKYGWLFLKSQEITNATRQAARIAIRPGDRSAEVESEITQRMADANINGYTYAVTPGTNPPVGAEVSVNITVPTANVDILNIPLLPTPATLGATIAMSKEGF
jgi:Flp pilus assembly protein TadG